MGDLLKKYRLITIGIPEDLLGLEKTIDNLDKDDCLTTNKCFLVSNEQWERKLSISWDQIADNTITIYRLDLERIDNNLLFKKESKEVLLDNGLWFLKEEDKEAYLFKTYQGYIETVDVLDKDNETINCNNLVYTKKNVNI